MSGSAQGDQESRIAGPVFVVLLDRLLRLHRGARAAWLMAMRDGLRRFPEIESRDETSLLWGIALRDAVNRAIFLFHTRQPRLAVALAKRIPIVDVPLELRDVPPERPIVIGLMHLGPIYAAITLAMRLVEGRKVYVFHAGGELGHTMSRYLRDIGAIPVLNERGSLAHVSACLSDGSPSAVIICFDYLGRRGNLSVPFLGGSLFVPTGLARLVEQSGALMALGWWETVRGLPRLRVGGIHSIDDTVAPEDRCPEFMRRIYRILEMRVRDLPQAWTEWRGSV